MARVHLLASASHKRPRVYHTLSPRKLVHHPLLPARISGRPAFGMSVDAEGSEERRVVPPARLDLHPHLEEDLRRQELLDLEARGGGHPLEEPALAADEDPLLVLLLHEDDRLDPHEPVLPLLPGLDEDGRLVGDLLARVEADLLADHLRGEEALGLIGRLIRGEEGWP